MAEPLLAMRDIRAGYGDSVVLDNVGFELPENGSLAVLGRNGVGKSTLFLTIMGYTTFRRGTIIWRGRDITRLAPHRRALLGIGWVAQEREIFPSLSVEENLLVAARPGPWDLARVTELFPRLAERRRKNGRGVGTSERVAARDGDGNGIGARMAARKNQWDGAARPDRVLQTPGRLSSVRQEPRWTASDWNFGGRRTARKRPRQRRSERD